MLPKSPPRSPPNGQILPHTGADQNSDQQQPTQQEEYSTNLKSSTTKTTKGAPKGKAPFTRVSSLDGLDTQLNPIPEEHTGKIKAEEGFIFTAQSHSKEKLLVQEPAILRPKPKIKLKKDTSARSQAGAKPTWK